MRGLLIAGGLFFSGLTVGCLIENTAHCGNQAGDTTCRERGTGMFCSVCTADNDGCVAQLPESNCQAGSGTTDATTDGTVGTATDSTATSSTNASSTTTTGPTTGPTTSSTGPSTTDATDSTTGSTTDPTGTTTGELCGNDQLDGGESCDGTKFSGPDTCAEATNNEKLGGDVVCTQDCMLDVSGCCLAAGQGGCTLGGCCNGLSCGAVSMVCE